MATVVAVVERTSTPAIGPTRAQACPVIATSPGLGPERTTGPSGEAAVAARRGGLPSEVPPASTVL